MDIQFDSILGLRMRGVIFKLPKKKELRGQPAIKPVDEFTISRPSSFSLKCNTEMKSI